MNMKKIICFTLFVSLAAGMSLAAGGDDDGTSSASSSSSSYGSSKEKVDIFSEVKTLIGLSKYKEAHLQLEKMKVGTKEADRLNLLGFTARKSGNLEVAGEYYAAALALHPKHTGALEYQGELFLQLDKIDEARANLTKIEKICWLPCNAERELRKAIEKYEAD